MCSYTCILIYVHTHNIEYYNYIMCLKFQVPYYGIRYVSMYCTRYVGIGILILASLYIHVYIHHVSQVSGSILQYIILYMDRYVLYQNSIPGNFVAIF